MKSIRFSKRRVLCLALCLALCLTLVSAWGKMRLQLLPSVSITEEYSDNYLRQTTGKQEEFVTSYAPALTLALQDEVNQVFLNYTPTYRDYKHLNGRDGLNHVISLEASVNPARHTRLEARAYSDGKKDDYQGDSSERTASLSGTTQVGKATDLTYSHHYARLYEEQVRTGAYETHTRGTTRAGLVHQYGQKNFFKADLAYESDKFQASDAESYTKIEPFSTVTHWFSALYGLEGNLGYLNKDFNQDINDEDTYSGHLKFLRSFSKTLDGYVKYRHNYTETPRYTHHIYHPSIGVDWDVSEDSGISLGVGMLIHDRSDHAQSGTDPFIDLDAFKRFDFSPVTALILTGSSDYGASGDTGASLGYQTSYRVGAEFSHQMLKELNTFVFASYTRTDFSDPLVNRQDDSATLGTGLAWTPVKWLRFSLNYSLTDFRTNAARGDYRDNRVFFSISLVDPTPLGRESVLTRTEFEDRLFSPESNWRP